MVFSLIMRLFTGEAGIFLARLKRMAALYALMALFGLALVIFLVTALFIWTSIHLGSLNAALIFSGVFFVLLLVTYFLAARAGRKPVERDDDRLQRDIASIAGVAALANAPQLIRSMGTKRGLLAVPVAAAGFYGVYRLIMAFRDR